MSFVLDAVYLILLLVIGPVWLPLRLLRRKKLASPLRRLGLVRQIPEGPGAAVWFHAVSVGESLALRGLLQAFRRLRPKDRPFITSTTVTGLKVARSTYPDIPVLESPYDLGSAVKRFLARTRPALLVLMELELWPNLIQHCTNAGIPVIVANAKVSPRSLKGYRALRRIWPGFLNGVTLWLAQSPVNAARVRELGVPAAKILVTGNLKFDNAEVRDPGPDRVRLRLEHGFPPDARILLAGSTHRGEENLILQAADQWRKEFPGFRLVLAPRHPERVLEVLDLCRESGFKAGRRSRPNDPSDPEILLVDTLGELSILYALADVALVGGSLVPIGGHNLLEPASLGLPIVAGRHLDTVRETASALQDAGALRVMSDARELERGVAEILRDPASGALAARGATEVIRTHRGSVARTMSVISGFLPPAARPLEFQEHG